MKRIVYTLAVGKPKYAECAMGLARSLKLIGDTTTRVIITDIKGYAWDRYFDQVLEPQTTMEWIQFAKLTALDRTDADQVLFIDSDCLVFKRLDPIFDYCAGKGLCVQGVHVTSGEWLGKVEDHLRVNNIQSMPRFNGGMIYYERTDACRAMIANSFEEGKNAKQSGLICDTPWITDEGAISLAMARAGLDRNGNCHLIPDELDYMNTATGLIGKLDMDILKNRCAFLCRRFDIRYVEPTIFHASRYINFVVYWKQLERLAWLEKYEDEHGFGYMSPLHKMERSIQRRYLKLTKKFL